MNWGVAIPLLSAAMIMAAAGRVLYALWQGWRQDEMNTHGED